MKLPYEVQKTNGSHGLYATVDLPAGSIVVKLHGKYSNKPTRASIQVGERHIHSAYGGYVNHHCEANTLLMIAIKNLDGQQSVVPWYSRISGTLTSMAIGNPYPVLVATTLIPSGTQINFNYNHSESLLAEPFICDCCGNWIRGRDYKEPRLDKSSEIFEHRGFE